MDKKILENLRKWRDRTARREHVEFYRVLGNKSLEEIAETLPQSKAELLEIKGIKEKKYAKYGEDILEIVRGDREEFIENAEEARPRRVSLGLKKVYEVSQYLDNLNDKLQESEARVKGEVSSFEHRGNYIFFGIKDKRDESLLNCFMWNDDYEVSGVTIEAGMEIIIWGYPNVFKPSGRLSFQTKLVELVGEGLLKKAYEDLKNKLEGEGIFAPERKKALPEFTRTIGLITSNQGAAIGDFISNVGNYGYKIKFYASRVEGKQAVFDLIKGIKWFNENCPGQDILVIVRGGGSLESLQAFNTEALVREIAKSKIPVLAGIGHERDISLAALAADKMVSTPTAAALEIRQSWDEALYQIEAEEKNILNRFSDIVSKINNDIRESEVVLSRNLANIFERFRSARENFKNYLMRLKMMIDFNKGNIENIAKNLELDFIGKMIDTANVIKAFEEKIILHNPERQLALGYSLVSFGGKILRSVKNVKNGDEVDIKMSDGKIKSKVEKIISII